MMEQEMPTTESFEGAAQWDLHWIHCLQNCFLIVFDKIHNIFQYSSEAARNRFDYCFTILDASIQSKVNIREFGVAKIDRREPDHRIKMDPLNNFDFESKLMATSELIRILCFHYLANRYGPSARSTETVNKAEPPSHDDVIRNTCNATRTKEIKVESTTADAAKVASYLGEQKRLQCSPSLGRDSGLDRHLDKFKMRSDKIR